MGVNSRVKTNEVGVNSLQFPLLAYLKTADVVVLFKSNGCGTVVKGPDSNPHTALALGTYDENWSDISRWEILPKESEVILQNNFEDYK